MNDPLKKRKRKLTFTGEFPFSYRYLKESKHEKSSKMHQTEMIENGWCRKKKSHQLRVNENGLIVHRPRQGSLSAFTLISLSKNYESIYQSRGLGGASWGEITFSPHISVSLGRFRRFLYHATYIGFSRKPLELFMLIIFKNS